MRDEGPLRNQRPFFVCCLVLPHLHAPKHQIGRIDGLYSYRVPSRWRLILLMANDNDISTWDRGELVSTIGPLSIFRTATAYQPAPADGGNASAIEIEHRYTVRVDPAWITDGGVVAFELEPPYFAVSTGNQLDIVDSLVEFTSNPDSENPEINILVLEPATTGTEGTFATALGVRCE